MSADLDELLAANLPEPETAVTVVRTERKCKRHQWIGNTSGVTGEDYVYCHRCHVIRDDTRSRHGKSSRRLGGDQERRAEKRYGWTKIGERGEKTDLRGRLFKVQSKASRRPPPALIRDTFAGLDATKDGRVPLLLLTFVRPGVPADDYIVIRGSDWLDLHGRDEEETSDVG